MKFGLRTPSLKRRIAARTSWKRAVRHRMGLKAPRGMGFVANPKKAVYNRIYNRTSISVDRLAKGASPKVKRNSLDGKAMTVTKHTDGTIDCPSCGTNMGQPKKIGWLVKKFVYHCPACRIKATVN